MSWARRAIRASAAPRYRAPGYLPSSRAVTPCRHSTYRIGVSFSRRSQGDERLTAQGVKAATLRSQGSRVPPERISHAVWLHHRFCVSVREIEDLLAPRGMTDTLRPRRAGVCRSCPRCRIARGSTTTPEPRCRTSRRDTANDRCAGCPPVAQAHAFSRCRGSCCICFAWGATYCESSTVACSQRARAASGTRRRMPAER